jgi:hypothetical protein
VNVSTAAIGDGQVRGHGGQLSDRERVHRILERLDLHPVAAATLEDHLCLTLAAQRDARDVVHRQRRTGEQLFRLLGLDRRGRLEPSVAHDGRDGGGGEQIDEDDG